MSKIFDNIETKFEEGLHTIPGSATIIFDFFCSLSRTLPFVSVLVRGKEDEGVGGEGGKDVHNLLGTTEGFAFHARSVIRLLKNANAMSYRRHRRMALSVLPGRLHVAAPPVIQQVA